MRKHRFFIHDSLELETTITLEGELSHQITRVLRLQVEDRIYLFNNSGLEYAAVIQAITRNAVIVMITSIDTTNTESPCAINLGQVIGKGEKMDYVIQKATELGVHSITPLYSENSVIKYTPEKITSKIMHWQKIAIAACCQSWRNIVPVVYPPQPLTKWIENNTDVNKLILTPDSTAQKLKINNTQMPISILIGPEGGFSTAEVNVALANKFSAISLGPRILRTETAGLAVIAILQAFYGDIC